jgi:hypothetical protein
MSSIEDGSVIELEIYVKKISRMHNSCGSVAQAILSELGLA